MLPNLAKLAVSWPSLQGEIRPAHFVARQCQQENSDVINLGGVRIPWSHWVYVQHEWTPGAGRVPQVHGATQLQERGGEGEVACGSAFLTSVDLAKKKWGQAVHHYFGPLSCEVINKATSGHYHVK